MTTTPKTKSYYERVLSKIEARRFRENDRQTCIDFLQPRSNKNKLECKKSGCNEFCVPNY